MPKEQYKVSIICVIKKVYSANIAINLFGVSFATHKNIALSVSFAQMGKTGKNYIDPALAEMVAERIQQLRKDYNHTQEFLIDKVKLDINRYEICDRLPTLMSLRKICEFYDITLAEFFTSMNYPPKKGKEVDRMPSKK